MFVLFYFYITLTLVYEKKIRRKIQREKHRKKERKKERQTLSERER